MSSTDLIILAAENGGQSTTGFFDLITALLTNTKNVVILTAGVAALVFILWHAITSKGTMTRIIMAGLAAGVFLFLVNNINDVKDRVDNEVNTNTTVTNTP